MSVLMSLVLAGAAAASPGTQADEVLAKLRDALGGEAKLATVKSLSIEADLRRLIPTNGEPRDMSGELSVDALLPDRYLKVESLSPFPGAPGFSVGTGLDGTQAWQAPMGTAGPNMLVRVGGPSTPAAAEALRRRLQAELVRLLLVSLGRGPEGVGLSFAYAGEAEAPEGRAQLLDVSGPDGFSARLFVDAATHLPLMVSFKTTVPRMHVMQMQGPADAGRGHQPPTEAGPPTEAEAKLFVSGYKSVGGVKLPHSFSQRIEGGSSEEWQVRRWKLNPDLKADAFRKRS